MSKSKLCRLGWHGWVTKYTEDREPYRACKRCDKIYPSPPGAGDKYFIPQGGAGF